MVSTFPEIRMNENQINKVQKIISIILKKYVQYDKLWESKQLFLGAYFLYK